MSESVDEGLGSGAGEDSPFPRFASWLALAFEREPDVAHAAALATADADGRPSCRIVLVRYAPPDTAAEGAPRAAAFEFHTSYESQKGHDLAARPEAALTFHWKSLGRQVRIEGPVQRLEPAGSDAYWEGRPRESQISATASRQSAPIESHSVLERRHEELSMQLEGQAVPRPDHWGGYRLVPLRIEFWEHRDDRLHTRLDWRRTTAAAPWAAAILQP